MMDAFKKEQKCDVYIDSFTQRRMAKEMIDLYIHT